MSTPIAGHSHCEIDSRSALGKLSAVPQRTIPSLLMEVAHIGAWADADLPSCASTIVVATDEGTDLDATLTALSTPDLNIQSPAINQFMNESAYEQPWNIHLGTEQAGDNMEAELHILIMLVFC
ncbi:hypothetical protein ABW20_dc0100475 [Dactylellina cionopaga]|nr:hypothetical protein ABW20_dc0100475 [Dactylellina cionopaga]